jgi:hypothetical protein
MSKEKNIVAYPVLININKNTSTIEIPDFELIVDEINKDIAESIVIARNNIISCIDDLLENEREIPDPNSIDFKKNKNKILTYVDVDLGRMKKKNKTLEELETLDSEKINSMWDVSENCVEFIKRQKVMTATFSQIKFSNKIKKLASKYPEEVRIVKENKDGSIYAKLPVSYLHIYRPNSGPKKEYTLEEKMAFRERVTRRKMGDDNVEVNTEE